MEKNQKKFHFTWLELLGALVPLFVVCYVVASFLSKSNIDITSEGLVGVFLTFTLSIIMIALMILGIGIYSSVANFKQRDQEVGLIAEKAMEKIRGYETEASKKLLALKKFYKSAKEFFDSIEQTYESMPDDVVKKAKALEGAWSKLSDLDNSGVSANVNDIRTSDFNIASAYSGPNSPFLVSAAQDSNTNLTSARAMSSNDLSASLVSGWRVCGYCGHGYYMDSRTSISTACPQCRRF